MPWAAAPIVLAEALPGSRSEKVKTIPSHKLETNQHTVKNTLTSNLMKKILSLVSVTALALSAQATITTSKIVVGSATDFPTTSISAANGSLSFSTILTTPAGATIAGGQAQYGVATTTAHAPYNNAPVHCHGSTDGVAHVTASGGTLGAFPYTFSWTGV